MAEIFENAPTRLPDNASVEAVLARLPGGTDDSALAAALTEAFPGFAFTAVNDVMNIGGSSVRCLPPMELGSPSADHG